MNAYLVCTIALAAMLSTRSSFAHGRSEQMNQELNAKTPEWLSIGAPIKVEPSATVAENGAVFRPRSGGATNSRNRVQIPARGIEIRVDYEIDWTGNNEAGTGSSLSPDGTRLIVNSGPSSHLYEILPNGESREVPLLLPHVTYDVGRKGYLREWSWADDQTLIARAEITDNAGHEIVENRIYVFHMNERALSRLDLSALNLPTTDGLEITKVGSDLNHLKIIVGDSEFTVKADLKSPPKIKKQEPDTSKTTAPLTASKQSPSKTSEAKALTTSEEPTSSTPWSIIVVLIVGVIGLLWFLLKKAKVNGL